VDRRCSAPRSSLVGTSRPSPPEQAALFVHLQTCCYASSSSYGHGRADRLGLLLLAVTHATGGTAASAAGAARTSDRRGPLVVRPCSQRCRLPGVAPACADAFRVPPSRPTFFCHLAARLRARRLVGHADQESPNMLIGQVLTCRSTLPARSERPRVLSERSVRDLVR